MNRLLRFGAVLLSHPLFTSATKEKNKMNRIAISSIGLLTILAGAMGHVSATQDGTDESQSKSVKVELSQSSNWVQHDFWMTVSGKVPGDNWTFENDEIRLVSPSGGQGSLLSPPLPALFELSFEWNIPAKTNSGLKYRTRRFGQQWLGLEYQILDEPPRIEQSSKGGTASIYDLFAPSKERLLKPSGEWNSGKIVATRDRLEHYLNGMLVASVSTEGPEWDRALALSKFYGRSGFGQAMEGDRILLTDHGGKASFRNFRFQKLGLPSSKDGRVDPKTKWTKPQLGNALRNGWADQTSIVLWSRTTARSGRIVDGPLFNKLSNEQVNQLSKSSNVEELVAVQLPSQMILSEMDGACPGAPGEIRLTYFPAEQRNRVTTLPWQTTIAEYDFAVQWRLEGLQPGTEFAAVVETRPIGSDKITAVIRGTFQTAVQTEESRPLSFCLTTCHDYIRRDDGNQGHKIYSPMTAMKPDFVVHAGDIEYYDHTSPWGWTVDLMRFKWGRLFALPKNRNFYANTTSYFLKDDHDTLRNDTFRGDRYGAVTFEEGVRLFNEEQFPSHDPRYKTIRWGKDLQVWLLEGRDFRSPNKMKDGPEKTILGSEQKGWLFQTLKESNATFKLVFSPTPIVGPDRANKHDNHANDDFQFEGNELRNFFAQIDGVILFCGDRHWQYASVDRQLGLWEFGCGPGSEVHQLGWKEGDVRPEHQFLRVAGGFLSGQLAPSDENGKSLTLRHHTVTGETVSEFRFPIKH